MNTLKTASILRMAGRRVASSGSRGLTTGAAFRQGSSSTSTKSILVAAGLAVAATSIIELQRQEVCAVG